ncbi:DUF5689 domain-containing protein [Urechidicola sp. KH5]
MKTIKLFKLLSFIAFTALAVGCVDDDEYDVPPISGVEPDINVNSSIEAARSAFDQNFIDNDESVYTFEATNDGLYFEGYVVSSDYGGNFYKTLIIQDKPVDPEFGIEVLVDKTSLFESFEFGRKIYVKLDGLSITYDDGDDDDPTDGTPGRYRLGSLIDGEVDDISAFTYDDHLIRSLITETIVPKTIAAGEYTAENINLMVQVPNMQFALSELGKTYAGEANDEFDGNRFLMSCDDESMATLQTSTFSDFKSYTISEGKGNLNAILSKDFFGENFVFIINNPTNLEFTDENRCDPVILDCGNNSVGGAQVLLDESFEGTSEAQLMTDGWSWTNVNGGSENFELRSFGGNSYMQASAFRSGEEPMEAWLITPIINLDGTTDEELTFETKVGFHNGDALTVFVSTDYSGDIDTATWALVDADLADSPSSGYGSSFTPSGSINISCLEGDVVVAFRYLGSDSGITTTFQVENVKVTGN